VLELKYWGGADKSPAGNFTLVWPESLQPS